jgi:hypothetical protein
MSNGAKLLVRMPGGTSSWSDVDCSDVLAYILAVERGRLARLITILFSRHGYKLDARDDGHGGSGGVQKSHQR